MGNLDGQQYFSEADSLFQSGRFEEALGVLRSLNTAYPNMKNVLYPMAMCLEHLGRGDEALPICATLVEQFQDPRAQEMTLRLRPSLMDNPLESVEFDSDYVLPDLGPIQTVAVPEQEEEKTPPWKIWASVGGGSAGLLVVLCAPFLLQRLGVTSAPQDPSESVSALSILQLGVFMITFIVFQGLGTGVASVALATVKKLPANSFSGVLLNVGMTLLGASVFAAMLSLLLSAVAPVSLIPTFCVLENIVMVAVFSYVYRFSLGDAIVFFGFFFIFMCVVVAVGMFLLTIGVVGYIGTSSIGEYIQTGSY